MKVTTDGELNPEWLQSQASRDKLLTKIRAYYLPGPKTKQDVQCRAAKCIMPTRLPGALNEKTLKEEFNPMIFCYFCDRTYHVGCCNLDSALLKEEKVPWRCVDCLADLTNQYASKYGKESSYKLTLKQRRTKFLRESVIPESDEAQFSSDAEFETADKESFKRRALQVASQQDQTMNLTSLDEAGAMEVLQHSVMRAKADERRAHETSKKVLTELESEKRKSREFSAKLEELQKQMQQLMQQSTQSITTVPTIQITPTITSTMLPSTSTQTLTQFYTAGDKSAANEQQSWSYQPQPVDRQSTNANLSSTNVESNADISNLLTRLTTSQERSEERHLLEMRRKAIPKITEFNGDSAKWLAFRQDVERYRVNCRFDDETVKLYLRGALKGDAFELVRDVFDSQSLDVIMGILKSAYGDEMMLIRKRSDELRQVKVDSHLYRSEVVKLQAAIQAYFSACNYAGIGYLNANELGESIFAQFNPEDRQRCKEFYRSRQPNATTIVICIQTIYDYLLSRMPLLDDVPFKKKEKGSPSNRDEKSNRKTFQIHAVAESTPKSSSDSDSYKFELRDKQTAVYMGYDTTKVNSIAKKCEICSKVDHFTFQCPQYRAMSEKERLKVISEKNICRSCVVTKTHKANSCDLKSGCGMKLDRSSRCTQKHHISIHNACSSPSNNKSTHKGKRRSNTNANTASATEKIQNAASKETTEAVAVSFHAVEPVEPVEVKRTYEVASAISNVNGSKDERRSVKVFKLNFFGPNGVVTEYAVGDSGSEVSLIRDDLREALGIEGTPKALEVQWSDRTKKISMATKFDLTVKGVSKGCERHVLRNCYAVNFLNLPERTLNMELLRQQYPYLKEVEFDSYCNKQPVMLIGSPHAYLIEGNGTLFEGGEGGPVALSTKLGWTVYGGSSTSSQSVNSIQTATKPEMNEESTVPIETSVETNDSSVELVETQQKPAVTNEDLSEMLDKFHSIESLGIRTKETQMTEDERKAVEIIKEEMRVLDDGTVEVPLAWNRLGKEIPSLPNNYHMVLKRQMAHEAKLRKNPDQLKAFNDNVKELLELGFLRYATEEDLSTKWPNVWYLPMSLVVNANKDPPKMRNVYDASAVYQSVSLNSKLLKGPDLLVNILQPLLKMRMSRYAFTADVAKMFHMMRLSKRDQQCQRILYRENHEEPMKILILCVMSFGPTSSPFTSQYVKNWNADRFIDVYPDAANTLKQYTYMDDVLTSEPTLEKAVTVAKQCIEICDTIGWKLVSFQSNSVELLHSLPPSTVKKDIIPLLESEMDTHVTKVLGCSWNTKSDCFEFHLDNNLFVKLVNEFDHRPTKRDQASTIARIYDSFGFIACYTILGKILLQRSWQLKLDWDQIIPVEESNLWKQWLNEINNISKLQIPRRYTKLNSILLADELEIHTFSDAGGEAFGAVSYLVVRKGSAVETKIIMAKAKVTPLRLKSKSTITEMPRLELIAALTAARLSNTIVSIYQQVKLTRYFWSDSEIVLRWILNPNHRLVKYAISPVEEILDLTERKEWRYVPTKLNPADLCTKFRKFDVATFNSMWMNGPEFLKMTKENWPEMPAKLFKDESVMSNNIQLETMNYATHQLPPVDCTFANDAAIDRFSPSITAKWPKLLRATARALKLYMDGFVPLVKIKQYNNLELRKKLRTIMNSYQDLTSMDLERAEHFIFRKIQRESFPEEYKLLKNGYAIKNKEFQQLNIFMDQEGLMRINSRVNLNVTDYPQQFSPFLPRKNALVSIFLMHFHQKFKHVATEAQMAEVRTKCWIPQLRTAMRSVKSKCNECNLRRAKPYEPPMAPLPDYRTNPESRPFEVTGIDVFGPIIINRSKKIYILIFVCALTRYVHLHILESLESLRVLEAIIVFWTAYGPVRKFVSDNGTNFRGAARILREDYLDSKHFIQTQASILQPKLSELYCIEWEFISAYAPWFGGLYERLIKEVKRALHDTLHDRRVHKVELNIAIHETAHRLNCRPLLENSLDAADEEILTPHHLAKNRSGWPLLAGLHKNKFIQVDDRSIYRRGRLLADEIMRKFVAYYLPTLTKRSKWHKDGDAIKVDDLVLMIEPNQTRRQWKRGRVIRLHSGRDGHVRSADIILASGKIKLNRAVRNLAKIKISSNEVDSSVESFNTNFISTSHSSTPSDLKFTTNNLFASERINFNSIFLLISFTQVAYSQLAVVMAGGKRRRQSKPSRSVRVVQLANVSISTSLSSVVHVLMNNFDSIVAIFRASDHINAVQEAIVYIYLTNEEEVNRLLEIESFFVNGQIVVATNPNLVPGVSEFPVDIRDRAGADIKGGPIPVGLFKLRSMPQTHTTFYVHALLRNFEKHTRVTGLRLIYDECSRKTRSFGFLSVLTRLNMIDLLNRRFKIFGDFIKTEHTNNTQVLLPQDMANVFNERFRCELTPEVQRANRLCFDASKLTFTIATQPIASTSRAVITRDANVESAPQQQDPVVESRAQSEADDISAYTPPLPPPTVRITNAVEQSKVKLKRKQKRKTRKRTCVDIDDLSSSISGLSIGEDYQLDDNGKISRGP